MWMIFKNKRKHPKFSNNLSSNCGAQQNETILQENFLNFTLTVGRQIMLPLALPCSPLPCHPQRPILSKENTMLGAKHDTFVDDFNCF